MDGQTSVLAMLGLPTAKSYTVSHYQPLSPPSSPPSSSELQCSGQSTLHIVTPLIVIISFEIGPNVMCSFY